MLARLNGLIPPETSLPDRVAAAVGATPPSPAVAVPIGDARALQASAGLSEAEFFARHGFVLLSHASAVRDWDAPDAYRSEIEALIRDRLLPGRRVEIQQPRVLRRGRGTAMPFYAEGVHSDGGLDLDDYAWNVSAFAGEAAAAGWCRRYGQDDVLGMISIDFWRPTGMAGPLEHMPLTVLDTASLDPADIVPTLLTGIAPEGRPTRHLALRHNPAQRWWHYPRMTVDEVLAFKLSEFWKEPTPPRNCFHSAFRDPGAPPDAELRQSCEHRVGALVLRD